MKQKVSCKKIIDLDIKKIMFAVKIIYLDTEISIEK